MDWNWSKMSAFDLLSLRSVPLNFSGAVPMLSWRFDLMYLQNGLELFWASLLGWCCLQISIPPGGSVFYIPPGCTCSLPKIPFFSPV